MGARGKAKRRPGNRPPLGFKALKEFPKTDISRIEPLNLIEMGVSADVRSVTAVPFGAF